GPTWRPAAASTHIDAISPFHVPRTLRGTPGNFWTSGMRHSQRSYAVRSSVTIKTAAEKNLSHVKSNSPLVTHELTAKIAITTAAVSFTTIARFMPQTPGDSTRLERTRGLPHGSTSV